MELGHDNAMGKAKAAQVEPPIFKAHTFEVHFHSHHNPGLEYDAVLESFMGSSFGLVGPRSPGVGQHIVFHFYNGNQKFLHGTAKIRTVTALDDSRVQIECELVQADPNALKFVEKVFAARQEDVHEWLNSLREV